MRTAAVMPLPNFGRSYPDRTSLAGSGVYKVLPFPILEDNANALNFVCEFNGGANANETGVGGGLTGADLVFSQQNSVPGVASGGRQLTDGTNMGFTWPAAAWNAFTVNPTNGFSFVWRFDNLSAATGGYYGGSSVYLLVGNPIVGTSYIQIGSFGPAIAAIVHAVFRPGAIVYMDAARVADYLPQATEITIISSFDYVANLHAVGLFHGPTPPAFLNKGKYQAVLAGAAMGKDTTGRSTADYIVGSAASTGGGNGSVTLGSRILSFTACKYPLIVAA